jgi:hypothetical protein
VPIYRLSISIKLMESFSHFHESVNEMIKQRDSVTMQVSDRLQRKLAADPLQFVDMFVALALA